MRLPVAVSSSDEDSYMDDDCGDPTPWMEIPQFPMLQLPTVSPDECVALFLHEYATPVKFVLTEPCTVHNLLT